jgi:hypothetical protein
MKKKKMHKLNIRYRDMQAAEKTSRSYVLTFTILIALILSLMAWKVSVFLR